jgi:hypothetical protein
MENAGESKQDGYRQLTKARVMGKLFGKEKKASTEQDVSAFLNSSSDKLYMTGASPPVLKKIDTSSASRWPTAAQVNLIQNSPKDIFASPKRNKKGMAVRFTDRHPEIIGEGGDEAEAPTISISQLKARSNTHPPVNHQHAQFGPVRAATTRERQNNSSTNTEREQDFRPGPIRRTQTGLLEIDLPPGSTTEFDGEGGNHLRPTKFLRSEPSDPNSFAARVNAEMRASEGKALLQGHTTIAVDPADQSASIDNISTNLSIRTSPQSPSYAQRQIIPTGVDGRDDGNLSRAKSSPQAYGHDATSLATGVNSVADFSNRVKHLFKLFELSAETVIPIMSVSIEEFVRAASWWFLKGRTSLELAARNRPTSPESQRSKDFLLQQGHTNLAKALWIVEDVISQRSEFGSRKADDLSDQIEAARRTRDDNKVDILETSQGIMINLQKLCQSMKRNGLLPPDEAILPQGLDNTIWISYPAFTPDIPFLLSGNPGTSLGPQKFPPCKLVETLPLADTQQSYVYNRLYVDLYLMEERIESREFRCPCILSILRPQISKDLTIVIASQNGLVNMRIQHDKARGYTWNDLKWRATSSNIEIKLARGFIAVVQFSVADFKALWNIYDYTMKTHANLQPREDEEIVFDKVLEAVQYFDDNPHSHIFPKEPVPNCQLRLFEKNFRQVEGTGARNKHRGFRLAVITHPKTKNLIGLTQEMPTSRPIQLGFMRGGTGAPALLLKFDSSNSTQRSTIVLNFDEIEDRSLIHSCLIGGPRDYETESAHCPIKKFSISYISTAPTSPTSPTAQDDSAARNALDALEWQNVRVVQKGNNSDPEHLESVLSESLRVIVESRDGSITDRINVAPGELKIRLNTQPLIHEISIFREAQEDMTITVSEAKVSRELPLQLAELLSNVSKSQSLRKYCFSNPEELHTFLLATTGFRVLFDGMTDSFAISRRRMVVPIYKKWEATVARILILRHEKVVQLAVFFEGFAHGDSMNFSMKATDSYESWNRGNKFYVRLVDAKFAPPKGGDGKYDGADRGYICLDMPDYPSEHDDLTIAFENETGARISCPPNAMLNTLTNRSQIEIDSQRHYLRQQKRYHDWVRSVGSLFPTRQVEPWMEHHQIHSFGSSICMLAFERLLWYTQRRFILNLIRGQDSVDL